MNESYSLDKNLQFIKEGDGENVYILSPFFPFNYDFVKDYFLDLNLNNAQFVFSSLKVVKNVNIELFSYNNFLNSYSRILNLLPNKKIYLIAFGVFANLFVNLAFNFRNKIASIVLLEPDFPYVIFNKLFESKKKPFNKTKFVINYFLENEKKSVHDNYLSSIKMDYLKYFFKSTKEGMNKDKLRELIDYIPDKIEKGIFKENIFDCVVNKKDKKYLLDSYREERGYFVLSNVKKSDLERLKMKRVLDSVNYTSKVFVYWRIMSRESWPLAQILEEYSIPLFNMHENIYNSFTLPDEKLSFSLKKCLS